jgi:glycosyltransferase involved in cell wall biosynthesis
MTDQTLSPTIALCLEYPLTIRGGVSIIVEELIIGLSKDFRFWLVSPDDTEALRGEPVFSHLVGHIPFQIPCLPPKKAFHLAAGGLADHLRSEGVSLVHFHAGGTFGWGNRWPRASVPKFCADSGLKTLWTNHSTEFSSAGFTFHGRPPWISRFLAPLAVAGKTSQMRTVNAEIAVSEHDKAFLSRNFPGAADKLQRIYHSRLEANLPEPREPRQRTILAVGHIAYRKGQDVLVRAFLDIAHLFLDWKLVLAGHDGGDDCWQEIERIRANHSAGSRIHLLGAHQHPMELMATASLFVQPSREEALGLALQEALFLGCPAIGSRVGGIPEVIDEGLTGLLVPPDDPPALAEALQHLMDNEKLRRVMGAAGHAAILAKRMTHQAMIESHRQLYLELISNNS